MPEGWRLAWANQRLAIVERLLSHDVDAGYPEAVLIIGAVISALAAERWPGNGIDHTRFVELLVAAAPADLTRISIPLLVDRLRKKGREALARAISSQLRVTEKALVLCDRDIDRGESDVMRACPQIGSPDVRRHSYANLIYTELRSPYVHEYRSGSRADSIPMTSSNAQVSYVNRINEKAQNERLIHFHAPFLLQLARAAASYCDAHADELPLPPPARWWIQGECADPGEAAGAAAKQMVAAARDGDTEAARDILREFTEAVELSSQSSWRGSIPWHCASHLADAFRKIVTNGTDAALALGIRPKKAGRPPGTKIERDLVLGTAYWLLVRRGRQPEEAKSLLLEHWGADRRTIERARDFCSTLGDAAQIDEEILKAILFQPSAPAGHERPYAEALAAIFDSE
jgi:hypothetical protein